uniref:Uncharacterized protein n=1 Tax=Arundo donax TaxID=35708 RepID=A0A0A9H284_ARUDO
MAKKCKLGVVVKFLGFCFSGKCVCCVCPDICERRCQKRRRTGVLHSLHGLCRLLES